MNSITRGAFLISAAMLIFTIMSGFVKATAPEVPAGQAMFFRAFFAIPVILIWLWWAGSLPSGLKTGTGKVTPSGALSALAPWVWDFGGWA